MADLWILLEAVLPWMLIAFLVFAFAAAFCVLIMWLANRRRAKRLRRSKPGHYELLRRLWFDND